MLIDIFLDLTPPETLIFSLYLSKFANSLFTSPKKSKLAKVKNLPLTKISTSKKQFFIAHKCKNTQKSVPLRYATFQSELTPLSFP